MTLNAEARLSFVDELIARKIEGHERETIADADVARYRKEFDQLMVQLAVASETSPLPDAPQATDALNDLLLRLRGVR